LKEPKKRYHIPLSLLPTDNSFKKVFLKPVFNPSELEEELLEFRKKKDEKSSGKGLVQYLLKNL